mmetsp:Transcript_2376/g.2437  ORF Transcript_2376/g.2437 Transcript_2376/m.2437 type:complete len:216 (-) Transcript_2376:46-693(-)
MTDSSQQSKQTKTGKDGKDYDYIFKIVLIGDTSVGKSSLLVRFSDDQFSDTYVTTIGVDFRFKTMIVKEKIVKVQIWDTAGQERYRSITNAYYRGAEAIIIVFDLSSKDSFNHIQGWIDEISKYTGPSVFKLILGNKCDLENPEVTKKDIEDLEKKLDVKIFEVSAKLSDNVDIAFRHVVESLIQKSNSVQLDKTAKNLLMRDGEEGSKKVKCCK